LKKSNGESIAVILVDTQGTFDALSTVRDNATIFGLSTLISSIQVYNLSQIIQEDHLQQLQLFSEYGKLAATGEMGADPTVKPFQTLMVLVRDWKDYKDYPLGETGGKQYLEKILKISEGQHEDLKSVREHIKNSFDNLSCFLLPHPGLDVIEKEDYDGNAAELRPTFREQLKGLVQAIFVNHLPVKKINGEELTCSDLLPYIKCYTEIYQSEKLPEPKTALQATAEANNLAAKEKALAFYTAAMEDLTRGDYIVPNELYNQHVVIKTQAVDQFTKVKKLGGASYSEQYRVQLEKLIDDLFPKYHRFNDSKAAYTTPLILGVSLFFAFLLSCSKADYLLESFWLDYQFILWPLDMLFWGITFLTFFYMIAQWKRNQIPSFDTPLRAIDTGAHIFNRRMQPVVGVAQRTLLQAMVASAGAGAGSKPKTD